MEEEQFVRGANRVIVEIDLEALKDAAHSAQLAQAFRQLHQKNQTEYACIHEYKHIHHLSNKIYKQNSLTGLFEGIYWLNFMSKKVWEIFLYKEKLDSLSAHQLEWSNNGESLFLQAFADLGQYATSEAESEVKRIYKVFRKAKRH